MSRNIAPHEPNEALVSSMDEIFQDAEASQKRWQEWEQGHLVKSIRIEVPEAEYSVLANLAQRQGKTVPQIIQALLEGILSTLIPPSQINVRGSAGGDK